MKTIKVGMIGAGMISSMHCAGIRKHPRAELIAICDKSRKRAKAIQKEFSVARVYHSIDDMIADRDVQAVSIALPNCLHAPTAIAALEAGKHVMLDKPFALNLREAKEVVRVAKARRRLFMVGMNLRFHDDAQMLRAIVERGLLGDVYHAKTAMLRRCAIPKFGTWFCRKDMAGGGVLLDLGVHAIDLAFFLLDNFRAEAVTGAVYSKFGHRSLGEGGWGISDREPGRRVFDVEDMATALVKLQGGASVAVEVSWMVHLGEPARRNVELFGTEGGGSLVPTSYCRFRNRGKEYEVVQPQSVAIRYPHRDRMVNWIDAILGRDKPQCTPAQALAVQSVIDAVYQSAKTGKEVRIR
jgi:predicted dehydrogenase